MGLGVWEIAVILVIVLIIFGAGKLPRVMGDLGQGIRNFKQGLNEVESPPATPSAAGADALPPRQDTPRSVGPSQA